MAEEKSEARAPARHRRGDTTPGTMRRIGARHCIVTEAVTAKVVDINRLTNELAQINRDIAQYDQATAQLRAQRTLLETRIAEFHAAPIDRDDDDPIVPLAAPQPETLAAPAAPAVADVIPPTEPSRDTAGKRSKKP